MLSVYCLLLPRLCLLFSVKRLSYTLLSLSFSVPNAYPEVWPGRVCIRKVSCRPPFPSTKVTSKSSSLSRSCPKTRRRRPRRRRKEGRRDSNFINFFSAGLTCVCLCAREEEEVETEQGCDTLESGHGKRRLSPLSNRNYLFFLFGIIAHLSNWPDPSPPSLSLSLSPLITLFHSLDPFHRGLVGVLWLARGGGGGERNNRGMVGEERGG